MEKNNSVLIIDDDDNIITLFSYILVKAGMRVHQVYNGYSACKWLEKNSPDLVLCDILMPDMNGMEVLTHIKNLEHMKNVPVLAVTALAATGYKEKLLDHGFDAYFSKPVDTKNFVSNIMQYVHAN